MVDYDGRMGASYAPGRRFGAGELESWIAGFVAALPSRRPLDVLDLGSGTGRFTPALAETFGGATYGVEPSDRMRSTAEAEPHPGVTYLAGAAEDIPLPTGSVDAVLMFLSFHHFPDPLRGLAEVRRVLRPGGTALLRSQFSDRMPDLFWYEYFPSARAADAAMYLSVAQALAVAEEAGLRPDPDVVLTPGPVPMTLRDSHERLRHRALSTFEHLSEAELDAGFARLAADAERDPDRVVPAAAATMLVLRAPA